jgi:hypothetical protein
MDKSKRGILYISPEGEMKRLPALDSKEAPYEYDFSPLFQAQLPSRPRLDRHDYFVTLRMPYATVKETRPNRWSKYRAEYSLIVVQLGGLMALEMPDGSFDPLPPAKCVTEFLDAWAPLLGNFDPEYGTDGVEGDGGVILLNCRNKSLELETKVKHLNFYEEEMLEWEARFKAIKESKQSTKRERPDELSKELPYPDSHDESSMLSDSESDSDEPPLKKQKVEDTERLYFCLNQSIAGDTILPYFRFSYQPSSRAEKLHEALTKLIDESISSAPCEGDDYAGNRLFDLFSGMAAGNLDEEAYPELKEFYNPKEWEERTSAIVTLTPTSVSLFHVYLVA